MAAWPDPLVLALAAALMALAVWYFWHVGAALLDGARRLAAWLDGRSARQRAALAHEARFGPAPAWLKLARFLAIGALGALLAVRLWMSMSAS